MYVCKLRDGRVFPTMLSSVKKTYLHHMFVYSQACNKCGWVSLVWGVISKGLFMWRGRWHQNCVRQGSIGKADHSWYCREIDRITGNYRLPQIDRITGNYRKKWDCKVLFGGREVCLRNYIPSLPRWGWVSSRLSGLLSEENMGKKQWMANIKQGTVPLVCICLQNILFVFLRVRWW